MDPTMGPGIAVGHGKAGKFKYKDRGCRKRTKRRAGGTWAEPSNSILTTKGSQLFNSWAPPAHLSRGPLSFAVSFLGPQLLCFLPLHSRQHLYFFVLLLPLGPTPISVWTIPPDLAHVSSPQVHSSHLHAAICQLIVLSSKL